MMPCERGSYSASAEADTSDYFLYQAGAGRRPPSLSLLPGCYVSMQYQRDKDARQVPTATPKARDLSCWNDLGFALKSPNFGEVRNSQKFQSNLIFQSSLEFKHAYKFLFRYRIAKLPSCN